MGFLNLIGLIIEGFAKAIVFVLILCAIIGFPVMWLWNWLMPVIFGLTEITFWQAVGLSTLFTLLFKVTPPSFSKINEKKKEDKTAE